MKLRDYQSTAVQEILGGFAHGKRSILLQSPCGAGKTEMASDVIRYTDGRWLFVVPQGILRDQTAVRLRKLGLDVGVFGRDKLGRRDIDQPDDGSRIQVGTIQMLLARDARKQIQPAAICFDEAHHYEAEQWRTVRDRYPHALRLGLTATPERADGECLGPHLDMIVRGGTYQELRDLGLLMQTQIWQPKMTPMGLAEDPITAWQMAADGGRTIAFFLRVEEARDWARHFTEAGVPAACIDGERPNSYREAVLDEFRAGKLRVLTNVFCLTEGFDLPDVRVAILCRSFRFRGTYVQAVGRTLRAAPGKRDAIIIDLTGASLTHGDPGDDYDWDIDGSNSAPKGSAAPTNGGDATTRSPKEFDRQVTNESIIRVQHGATPEAEFPAFYELPGRDLGWFKTYSSARDEARAKKLASRKGQKVGMDWLKLQQEMNQRIWF